MDEEAKKYHKTSVGGQALIEGIMMRGPKGSAMAVRLPNGEIETTYKKCKAVARQVQILRCSVNQRYCRVRRITRNRLRVSYGVG